MRTYSISTNAVSERERLEYWQETASRAFLHLRTEKNSQGPFFGTLDHRADSPLPITFLHSAPQRVYRGRPELALTSQALYFITMNLVGSSTVRQGGEERINKPGDFDVVDGTQPGELAFATEFRRVTISIPHHLLRPRLVDPGRAGGLVVHSKEGVGALASAYLRAFVYNKLAEPVVGTASDILLDLLALAINTTMGAAHTAPPSVREALRNKVRRDVEENLADPLLSPASVAARCRMSTRYLHSLFSETGTSFMRWVWSRRLECSWKELANPERGSRSIADVALDWGFKDLSHFSRSFKEKYGMTPREWRAEALRSPELQRAALKATQRRLC